MLQPRREKYRKQFRGKRRGLAVRGSKVSFGEYGLKCLEAGWITANQIEAARVAIGRQTRKGGKLWIRIFPDKPITSKPNEVGMGSGKGEVQNHVAVVRPGRIMFEISGVSVDDAHVALKLAASKLPIKTKIVAK